MNEKMEPIDRGQLVAENADLRYRLEMAEAVRVELEKRLIGAETELKKANEENQALRMMVKDADVERRLLSAQMEVVRLIFGKGGFNG